jgi:hypothetical protein
MNEDDDNDEVPISEEPGRDWWVRTSGGGLNPKTGLARECTHTLFYKGIPQNKAKGVSGLNAMSQQAAFMNAKKLVPNKEAECLADISGESGRSRKCKKWRKRR